MLFKRPGTPLPVTVKSQDIWSLAQALICARLLLPPLPPRSQVDHHGLVLDDTLGISAFCSQEAPFSLEASAQAAALILFVLEE